MQRFVGFVLLLFFCLPSFSVAADKGITTTKKTTTSTSNQRRLALVIGNSDYQHSGALANPASDAELIAKTLKDVGFDLHGGGAQLNLTRRNLDQAIESFGDSISSGDVALFYYSGHGLQVAGENYLVPIDANIKKESEIRVKAVPVNLLFAKLEGIPKAVNIVVLDACRNNPFARSFRSSSGGLAPVNAPTGTLVAFSTAPGQVAEDGAGNNSTYTASLAKYLKEPGLLVEQVFKKVRSDVNSATNGQQTPWENTSLTGNFKFIDAQTMKARLEKAGKARSAELERLLKMEAEAKAAKEREQAEIAARQAEVAKMDAEIAAMKARLGAGTATGNDSLDNMLSMVEQRETQAKKLEALRRQRADEERKREAEIARLKAEEEGKHRKVVEAEIAKYEKIVNSPYGKDMADAAWQSLVSKYVGVEEIANGDLEMFRQVSIDGLTVDEIRERLRAYVGELVSVPGGCFQMGDQFDYGDENEKPVHEVCVDTFRMGKFEITQGQWKRVMGNNPSNFKISDNYPVENVRWGEIQDFLLKLNSLTGKTFRLPTEAEWEYACRSGGRKEEYCGGDNHDALAWHMFNSGKKTHPVGQKQPNAFGLYDMSGNVGELCQDWYGGDYYTISPKHNPQGPPDGQNRIVRGGSSYDNTWHARSSVRGFMYGKFKDLGFRLVTQDMNKLTSNKSSISPTQDNNYCLNCHEEFQKELSSKTHIHGAVETGCTSCHSDHKDKNNLVLSSNFSRNVYGDFSSESFELCFRCHDSQLITSEFTEEATGFRDGKINLHFVHVLNGEKGRSCKACHDPHGTMQQKLILSNVPGFGKWKIPINYSVEGGNTTCVVGCHKPKTYNNSL